MQGSNSYFEYSALALMILLTLFLTLIFLVLTIKIVKVSNNYQKFIDRVNHSCPNIQKCINVCKESQKIQKTIH